MKTTRVGIIGTIILFTVGCSSLTTDQIAFIEQARNVKEYPVKRQLLTDTLGLGDLESESMGGGVRSGYMRFSEQWNHPCGLTLIGFDSEYVGQFEITRDNIDKFLNASGKISDIPGIPGGENTFSPRTSFNGITVTSGKGKVLYSSWITNK